MSGSRSSDAIEVFLRDGYDRRMELYKAFVRLPSISAEPEREAACRDAADWLAQDMRDCGIEHVSVEETGGHPIVFGDLLGAEGAPTAIVYGHYDVQPVDPLELWETPPFEPVVRGERMLGRGAEDNKSCVQMHLRAAEALVRTRGRAPLNLKFVFEGEEEIGSPHLDSWLDRNRARLAADLAVISDTDFFEGNRPAICTGVRGLIAIQIDVHGPGRDLHSGWFGGAVRNPANALAAIIASFVSPDGRILVPGFYDDVRDLDPAERSAIADLPFDGTAFRASIGVDELVGEVGYGPVEWTSVRPSLDVNGIWSGFSGDGIKTIIPRDAHAKLSCRLVPDQRPDAIYELLERHILRVAPSGVHVTLDRLGAALPASTPIDHPATRAAERALEATFGVRPVLYRAGGTVPVTASFADLLRLPVVLLGFAPPDSQAHAPNESMDLRNFETGIRTIVRYWEELGALTPAELARPSR